MILRVVTVLEGVVRHALAEQHQQIAGLFAGNPKRRTAPPTTERLLEASNEITLTICPAWALCNDIFLLFQRCNSRF